MPMFMTPFEKLCYLMTQKRNNKVNKIIFMMFKYKKQLLIKI